MPRSSSSRWAVAWGRVLLLFVGAGALAVCSPEIALGEGVVRDSIGPVSSGRGGTNLSFNDNLSLINDNPAGLATQDGLRFELDLDLLHTDINYKDPTNDADNKDTVYPVPTAAMSWRITDVPRPITVGLGFFMPAGFGSEIRLENDFYGRQDYRAEAALIKILPAFGIDLGAGFSIGGGIGPAIQTTSLETPFSFQTGALAGTPVLVDMDVDGYSYSWNVGIQYRPTDRLTLGVAYVSETEVDLEGDFSVDGTGVVPFPDATADYDVDTKKTWPRSLGAGASYRFDWGTFSVDGLWFDWSSAFDTWNFKLSNGDNPAFDAAAGPVIVDSFPLDWDDNFTIRVGGEVYLSEADTVRAGYIYMTNPVPDSTLTPLIPAILEHSVTVGYGRKFGQFAVDLAYQFSFGERRSVNQSDIVGGDFDNSSIRTMAHWFILGVSARF